MTNQILLSHGSGGRQTHDLIAQIFKRHFANPVLDQLTDSAILEAPIGKMAFTTDSYVVSPIEFPGGDIGKLAICGTVNDLAVCGAKPLYISCGFIIEEGLEFETLERIVESMAKTARDAGVTIVTGDTKVVDHGKADKLFINTAGIGVVTADVSTPKIKAGDKIIINGPLGEHGMAVMAARNNLAAAPGLKSDCAPLSSLIQNITGKFDIHFMRDPTRGGLVTTLNEITEQSGLGATIEEDRIEIPESVEALSELLGIDPLYVANEGKVVVIASAADADRIVEEMQRHPLGVKTKIIGEVHTNNPGKVHLKTVIGTTRLMTMLSGEQLPRIC